MNVSRRAVFGFAAGAWPAFAAAATDLERALDELSETFDVATRAYVNVAAGIRGLTAAMLRHSLYRPRLQEALTQLTELRAARLSLVQELRIFAEQARSGANARPVWNSSLRNANHVSELIVSCSDLIFDMPELSTALSVDERQALRDSFAARARLLISVRELPMPAGDAELGRVETLASRYEAWSNAANEVRLELHGALNRV